MYAIIETGGKQYRVQEGDIINVELLGPEQAVTFDRVLFMHDGNVAKIGFPHIPQCTVHAEMLEEVKGPKVIAFKYIPCKKARRKKGHRQRYSSVKITKITAGKD